jgi:glutamate dehydrogenase/leucine dehydrogenase
MLETTHAFIDEAARLLGLPAATVEKIKQTDHEHEFDIRLQSGKSFKAYRVQHNNLRGPYKGGIRFHHQVTPEEVRTLATLMSLKTAAAGLPLGGGKGGVVVDPRTLEPTELEELSREYVRHLYGHLGPDKDVPAPDVNTNAQIIDWMVDEYEKLTGDTDKASFTGKSVAAGGSLGRDAATGRGGVLVLAELLSLRHDTRKQLTFAVQGYGNVGSYFATTAKTLQKDWRLVAASDSEAAVYSPKGLDAVALLTFKKKRARFKDYKADDSGVQTLSNDELLSLDVDVLVLAGFENTVTAQNAAAIKAKYVVEMANGPVTAEAYDALTARGTVVVPDIIANAGGVVVSYLEWVQNREHEHWPEAKVNSKLAGYMKTAVKNMYDYSVTYQTDLKRAAFMVALAALTEEK